jgi:anti-sigma factor RsiW
MNLAELHRKLIAAARANAPEDRVPYAFEKRIMARLAGQTAPDALTLWGHAFSRAAVYCVIFMLMLAAGSYFAPAPVPGNTETLSQDVEQTLFAAVDNNADQESW